MISFALVVTVCSVAHGVERCDDYVRDMLPTMRECVEQVAAQRQLLDTKGIVGIGCQQAVDVSRAQ